jgi:hypothetical protein
MENHIRMKQHQVDIKGALINGLLSKLFIPGYEARDAGHLAVVKTLYGLEQSGRQWYQKLSFTLTSLGFTRCSIDQAVLLSRTSERTSSRPHGSGSAC